MGTITLLFLFSGVVERISKDLIDKSVAVLEPSRPTAAVHRANGPDDSWRCHIEEDAVSEHASEFYMARPLSIPHCRIEEISDHFLNENVPLTVDLSGSECRLHGELYEQAKALPSSCSKSFDLANCVLWFGYHDIFVPGDELAKPMFIARPQVSLHFWGYGLPNLDAYLSAVEALPAMTAIEAAYTELWGNTETALIPYFG